MSRERARKIQRLAAVKAFQEQQARQVFVAARAEAVRREQVEEACDTASRQHRAHVGVLLKEPALDVGRYLLASERSETAARIASVARHQSEQADTVAADAAASWNLRRVSAEVTAGRAADVDRHEERALDTRHASDLVDLLIARRRP